MALTALGVLASGSDTALSRSVALTFTPDVAIGTLCILTAGNDLTSTEASTITDPWGNIWTKHFTTTTGGHFTLYQCVLAHAIPAGGSWTWPSNARIVDVQGFTGLASVAAPNSPPADVELVSPVTQAFEWAASSQIFLPTHNPTPLIGAAAPGTINGWGFGITDSISYLVWYALWCKASIGQAVTTPTLTLPAGFTQGSNIRNPGTGTGNGTVFCMQTAYKVVTGPVAAPGITCAGGTITDDSWVEQHGIALIGPPDVFTVSADPAVAVWQVPNPSTQTRRGVSSGDECTGSRGISVNSDDCPSRGIGIAEPG